MKKAMEKTDELDAKGQFRRDFMILTVAASGLGSIVWLNKKTENRFKPEIDLTKLDKVPYQKHMA
ncbi:MAG: hypothetical protein GY804_14340 [Alphaproteobacteria bacterium]|nr:hypothetical protein [Alphaproteobacteria bacterium]